MRPQLTIGMPTLDDFDGVYFTVESLRLYHKPIIDNCEILVIDDNPSSKHGEETCKFCKNTKGVRYVATLGRVGSAVAKNLVFSEAKGDVVLCVDCHVLLWPGSLEFLAKFFEDRPGCLDLVHGVLVYSNHQECSTHMVEGWSGDMFGTWGHDKNISPLHPSSM